MLAPMGKRIYSTRYFIAILQYECLDECLLGQQLASVCAEEAARVRTLIIF